MTEDEARKKWCPFATVVAFNFQQNMIPVAINRTRGLGEQPTCLGSGCMAWIADANQARNGKCGMVESQSSQRVAAPRPAQAVPGAQALPAA